MSHTDFCGCRTEYSSAVVVVVPAAGSTATAVVFAHPASAAPRGNARWELAFVQFSDYIADPAGTMPQGVLRLYDGAMEVAGPFLLNPRVSTLVCTEGAYPMPPNPGWDGTLTGVITGLGGENFTGSSVVVVGWRVNAN